MKKIMFFDIDGTLLDFKTKKIPQSSIESLKKLQENGILIGIATGRQQSSVEKIFKNLLNFDFIISSNGRMVKVKDEIIYQEPMNLKTLEKLIEFDEKYQTGLLFQSSHENAVLKEVIQICKDYLDNLEIPYPIIDGNFHFNNSIYQTMIYCDEEIENIFKKEFTQLSFVRHAGNGIDVTTNGPLKDKGVEIILNYFNLSKKEALAFGDGLNDLGMFEYIDGASLKVAHQQLIEKSKYRLDSIENDGIYKFLKKEKYI